MDFDEVLRKAEQSDNNPYWERACNTAWKQREKGIVQYGQGIEFNQEDIHKRIEMLREELVDSLMYIGWVEDKIDEYFKRGENNAKD